MSERHDAWFFIGIFAFIFIVWIAVGGPTHPISFTGAGLSFPSPIGSGTYLQLPQAPFTIGGTSLGGVSSSLSSLPNGISFGDVSPYHNLVTLAHSVYNAGASDPSKEYLILSVSQNAGVPVDLSGWTLTSEATGNTSTIPKGTEVPRSGVVNAVQDIVLTPGTRAIIDSGRSPIGGSFRENKCIGYFSSFQSFYPQLPQTCPLPSDELSEFYGDASYIRDNACINYVDTIPRCQTTLTPPTTVSGACQSFVVKYLNYNGCLDAHENDSDFKGDTWRIYLGRTNAMWRTKNEVVKLLDKDGKTVDAFSY